MTARDIYKADLIKRGGQEDTDALVSLGEFYPELGEILMAYADLIEKYDAVAPNEVEKHGADERQTALEQAAAIVDRYMAGKHSFDNLGDEIRGLMDDTDD